MTQTKAQSSSKKTASSDPITKVWNTLKSMKFAIVLLLVITALTVVNLFANEFIVQVRGNEPGIAYATYNEVYGEPRATILTMTQMYAPYRSWWYNGLLGLLSLSLLVCVIDRSSLVWKLITGTRFISARSQFEGHDHFASLTGDGVLKQRTLDAIRGAGFSVQSKDTSKATLVHGRRASIAHLGAWIVHIGFIILVIGGALIARGEYRQDVQGYPGEFLAPDDSWWGFNVRVDDFIIEYYDLRAGQYVQIDGGERVGRIDTMNPNETANVEILWPTRGFEPNVQLDRIENRIDRRFGEGRLDQSNISDYIADLTVIDGGQEVMKKRIEVNAPLRYNGYRFYQSRFNDSRTDANGTWTTIIEARRDTGSPFIWVGIILVSIGLMLGLYLAPRDVFARIEEIDGKTAVLIAGISKGRATEFEKQFQTMVERIQPSTGEAGS
jgi:cytochrome c biogenesis protein